MIQEEAAAALLDSGVSLPLKVIRLPFGRKITLRATMRRPYLSTQIRIAELYLGTGMSCEEMEKLDKDGQMKYLARYGKIISRMVALTLVRGSLRARLLERPVAWLLRHFVADALLQGAFCNFVLLLGTQGFTNIIRSVEAANPMKLRLSHDGKGS